MNTNSFLLVTAMILFGHGTGITQQAARFLGLYKKFTATTEHSHSLEIYNNNRDWYLNPYRPEKDISGEARLYRNLVKLRHRKNINDIYARKLISEIFYDSYSIVDNNWNLSEYKTDLDSLRSYYVSNWKKAKYGGLINFHYGERILWDASDARCNDIGAEEYKRVLKKQDTRGFEELQLHLCFCEDDDKLNLLMKNLLQAYQNFLLSNNMIAMELMDSVLVLSSDLSDRQKKVLNQKYVSIAVIASVYERILKNYMIIREENARSSIQAISLKSLIEKLDTNNYLIASDYSASTFLKTKSKVRFTAILKLYKVSELEQKVIFKKIIDHNRKALMDELGAKDKVNELGMKDKVPIELLRIPNFGQMGIAINPMAGNNNEFIFEYKEKRNKSPNTLNQKK